MTIEHNIRSTSAAIGELIEVRSDCFKRYSTASNQIRLIVAAAAIMELRRKPNLTADEETSSAIALSSIDELARQLVNEYGLTSLSEASVNTVTGKVTFRSQLS